MKGDWIVVGPQVLEGVNMVLNGNLVVKRGGSLTLRNVKLSVNSASNGQYRISVEPGGSMYVYGSAISAANPERRFAFIAGGSAFEMKGSELHGVGWQAGKFEKAGDEAKGLLIETAGAVLESNTISGNTVGLVLRGDGAILKGNTFSSNDYQALDIASSRNTIVGNTFQHATTFDSFIISMGKSHNNTISGNTVLQKRLVSYPNMGGISAGQSWNNIIADNTMDVDWPVGMTNSSNNIIRNNKLTAREAAVWLRAGVNNRVVDNDIQLAEPGVRFGMLLVYAHDNVLAGNRLWGVAKGGYGAIYLDHSNRNQVLNNQVSVPIRASSLFLHASRDNLLTGNTVSGGGIGLFLYSDANGNKVHNNSIASELNSVFVDGSSGNTIYQNRFGRGKGPYDSGDNNWDFEGKGNQWDDYQGRDGNGDGIGDAPHKLLPAGEDKYPLVLPVEIRQSPVPETRPVSFAEGPRSIGVDNIVVTGERVIENQTLVMEAGSISVQPKGSLVVRDSTLILGGKGLVDIMAYEGAIRFERSVIKAAPGGYGFQLIIGQGASLVMKDSELHDASWNIGGGLFVERATSAVIENSLIMGSQLGLYLGRVESALITNNRFKGNSQGIMVDSSGDVVVEGNTIDGFVLTGIETVKPEGTRVTRLARNTVLNGWGDGIRVMSNAVVEGNTIEDVRGGLSVKGDGNIIRGNSLRNSGGLIVNGNGNVIHQNNFFGEKSGDGGKNNRWDDGSRGNYWSDYRGKDANGDGIGDTPYPISPNASDRYPLMKPIGSLK